MKKTIYFFIFFVLINLTVFAQTGSLRITISDIDSNEGNIKVALYDEANGENFLRNLDKAYIKKVISINNKKASLTLKNLPYGTYAVSIFQDINNDGEIDRASIGFPTEPYGISGNKFIIGHPKFKDCKFLINTSFKTINIEMKSFL